MTRRLIPLCCLLTLALAPACKKDGETQNPDEAAAEPQADENLDAAAEQEAAPALPAQDPDPAELADLYARLLIGDYEAVASDAAELRATMTADTQIRANGLLAGIEAMAAAKVIPENGKYPSEEAIIAGERLGDPEVLQLGHAAHAAYLIGVLEATAAQAEVEAVVGNEGAYAELAHLVLAQAHFNQAFGTGEEDTKIVNPGELDAAAAEYEAVAASSDPAIQAQAHEGLAVVYNNKSDKAKTCEHAATASELYTSAGASQDLLEGITYLADKAKCK
ncbi:hypothetical protein G6O69_11035 [Pseudenhygromyxa sp. WMMC2535]|uniref:hypothetical protein n=1 Tax=Pseudenhygromyxa sp. WMMC2535 TaxID=2712867 RepID=UPI001552ABB6|nr:hypothetical protein [Pseudenhygromyxa sp. WMMC2535]NVB38365.1 hypothetical protein [Pseudenhygromyxa sp. WMMC2535]